MNQPEEKPDPIKPTNLKFMGCRVWIQTSDDMLVRSLDQAFREWLIDQFGIRYMDPRQV